MSKNTQKGAKQKEPTPMGFHISNLKAAHFYTGQHPNSRVHLSKCCVGDPLWASY